MKAIVILLLMSILFAVPVGTGSAGQGAEADREQEGGSSSPPEERLEEFVPSEEISADRAISFPTDI